MLADAWSGQLLAANLPLFEVTRWTVPFIELLLGVVLAAVGFVRQALGMVIAIMTTATYVHVVVDNASLFPMQPSEPIIPLIVIVLSLYVLWKGAGSWSLDLKA